MNPVEHYNRSRKKLMNIADYANLYAERAHRGQVRKHTGAPYIVHPRQVAEKLLWYNSQPMYGKFMGCEICHTFTETHLAVAYLHDVIEDCNVTYEQLCDDFNFAVAGGVKALSNTSKITDPTASRATRKRLDRGGHWRARSVIPQGLPQRIPPAGGRIGAIGC